VKTGTKQLQWIGRLWTLAFGLWTQPLLHGQIRLNPSRSDQKKNSFLKQPPGRVSLFAPSAFIRVYTPRRSLTEAGLRLRIPKKIKNYQTNPFSNFAICLQTEGISRFLPKTPIKNEPIFIHFKNLSPLRLLPLNFPESRNWPCDLPKRARSGFGLRISFGYRISAFGSLSAFIRVHPCPSVVKVPKLLVSPMRIHATGFYCPPQAIFAHKHHGNHIFAGDSASPSRGTRVASLASKVAERHSYSAEKLSEPRI